MTTELPGPALFVKWVGGKGRLLAQLLPLLPPGAERMRHVEPVSRTASFTAYAEDGFGPDNQRHLRNVFAELARRGCRCMLSNSDAPLIREIYAGFRIDVVQAPRAINCDASRRGLVSELVIRSYW